MKKLLISLFLITYFAIIFVIMTAVTDKLAEIRGYYQQGLIESAEVGLYE